MMGFDDVFEVARGAEHRQPRDAWKRLADRDVPAAADLLRLPGGGAADSGALSGIDR